MFKVNLHRGLEIVMDPKQRKEFKKYKSVFNHVLASIRRQFLSRH